MGTRCFSGIKEIQPVYYFPVASEHQVDSLKKALSKFGVTGEQGEMNGRLCVIVEDISHQRIIDGHIEVTKLKTGSGRHGMGVF